MKFLDNYRRKSAASRLLEEQLYSEVVQELAEGTLRNGLWGQALEKANGDEIKAKSLYIPLRVQSMKDEAEIYQAIHEKEEKEALKKEISDEKIKKQEARDLANEKVRKAERLADGDNVATRRLRAKGYKVQKIDSYWLVNGRDKFNSYAELYKYAACAEIRRSLKS